MEKGIRISEIFGPTIQGEGTLIGKPTVFVRTGGCDFRCSWCDTLFAVDSSHRTSWRLMSANQIFKQVQSLAGNSPLLITLSGGNPATQPLLPLIQLAKQHQYTTALETQGSLSQPWFSELDHLTLSPKPPSSLMDTDMNILAQCVKDSGTNTQVILKVVVFDSNDFYYAKSIADYFPQIPFVLQTGNQQTTGPIKLTNLIESTKQLIDMTIENQWFNVTVLPQLHAILWGNERGR